MNKLKKILLTALATIMVMTFPARNAYAQPNMKFYGTLIAMTCSTNAVDVDFGEVSLDSIQAIGSIGRVGQTRSVTKPFTVTVTCTGAVTAGIKYQITGDIAPFYSNAIATNMSGLGIALSSYPSSVGIDIGTWYDTTSGSHEMRAILVRDASGTFSGGDFMGTATLTLQLP